ncbi:MiaB/RimO family radical SAM methylthiotransferase [bacterium]|nr:MiaB/RimO family radical SAM methylthiotransferase [bacterium]
MVNQGFFTTIGCKLNQAETAQISENFLIDGLIDKVSTNLSDPYIIFVNTCAVTTKAAAKSRHAVSKLAREYPEAIVIAAGCLAQHDPESLANINNVDYVLGTNERFSTDWWIGKPQNRIIAVDDLNKGCNKHLSPGISNRSRRFLKIQDGCEQGCYYCIIPQLRGKSRSVPKDHILRSACELIESGTQEIVLTGVRIGSWGNDLSNSDNLTNLLEALTAIPGNFRVRLGSIEPWELNQKLIEQVLYNDKVCPHLHVPFQHTESEILTRMGRPDLSTALVLLLDAKRENPHIAIGTDLIVGYPGETEENNSSLIKKISDFPLAYIHIFSFSRRPGTKASKLTGKISDNIIKERAALLNIIGKEKKRAFQQANINRELSVIPENYKSGSSWIQAVSDNYLKIRIKPCEIKTGKLLRVKTLWDDKYGLIGIINRSESIT